MRKIIAVLLTVLMIASVLAALPASAATYDGSTKTDAPSLFISEIAAYTHTMEYVDDQKQGTNTHALDFMEIYNNGSASVDLSTISILRAVDFASPADDESPYAKLHPFLTKRYDELWVRDKKFIAKVDIPTGKIIGDSLADMYGAFTDADGDISNGITNDVVFDFLTNSGVSTTLESGKNAIIWFINEKTVAWMRAKSSADFSFNPRNAFLKEFYPNMAASEYANYPIIMVWGWGDTFIYDDTTNGIISGDPANNMFTLTNMPAHNEKEYSYMFALAQKSWNLEDDAAIVSGALNSKIYSLTRFGAFFDTEDEFKNESLNDYSGAKSDAPAVFTVANKTPYVPNAYDKFLDEGAAQPTDYCAAGIVGSYMETGIINWSAGETTPGTMPVWQWAMLDPGHANAPDALKTSGAVDNAKVQAVIDAYIQNLGYVDDGSTGREETNKGPIEFESQESIANRFNNANKKEEDDKSWFEENLVLVIIIAAVVVLGGAAAVVVFVVILPKKKKAAAAAAAEAEVAEAPAEEAPAADDAQE
ncbi:MAG: hypothetical protein E7639_04705 [Ruminococcaceae bacterium]|nr:hypothetical protein [Oscillospiraceae bacterium]